ncbi:Guanine nucleotide-binding protein G(k) subunit alpha [Strongyloides ratti]|uniref:Guanine nucleotide-binding protein G(K) subunit alpha n=1 Tax=Strongyloides ratti TaxID=34506 RepID=A0A090MZ56_STRRB|nr:Guanine nucleotide-binding protein G(k) subunit alpha [Strongyloides ratti]CEF68349.1 Guanine nucleotide-binding protein G(k) subunit alpha [Strongyloides ratti]
MGSILSICGNDSKKIGIGNVPKIIDNNNDEINIQLNTESPVRFFMAGLGSAGKTTIIRQLQMLAINNNKRYRMYDEDWNEYDPNKWKKDFENNIIWRNIIRKNILDTFNIIIKYNERENIEYETEDNFNFAMELSESLDEDEDYEQIKENKPEFLVSLILLFEDSDFVKAFEHKNKIKLEGKKLFDGCDHFMKKEKIIEVFSDNYIPDESDKVRSRYPTQDMRTYRFKIYDTKIEINDIGGQKSERSKVGEFVKHWSLQGPSDSKNFILLVVGMSDYNEKHDEYEGTLLDECLEYMKNLLSNPYASKCGLLIFFNKRDKFLEKLNDPDCRNDIIYLKPYLDRTVYNEYKNTGNFKEEDMHKAIASKFAEIINSNKIKRERDTYCRFTCAIDKVMMESIFGTVYYEILKSKAVDEELFP